MCVCVCVHIAVFMVVNNTMMKGVVRVRAKGKKRETRSYDRDREGRFFHPPSVRGSMAPISSWLTTLAGRP